MTVLSIILGILLVIGGFSCMFTPLATFLYTGFYLALLLLVYGVVGVVRFVKKEAGVLELIVSILAIPAGLIAMFRPGGTLVFDGFVLRLIAAWLLVQGVAAIVLGFMAKGERGGWFLGVIAGVLGIIAAFISFTHPVLTAATAGFLIGFHFVETGFNMIVLGAAVGSSK